MRRKPSPEPTVILPRLGHSPGITDIRITTPGQPFWARPNLYDLPSSGSRQELDAARPMVLPLFAKIALNQDNARSISSSWPREPDPRLPDHPDAGDWFLILRQHVGPDVSNAAGVYSNIWNAVLVPAHRVEGQPTRFESHEGRFPYCVAYTSDLWTGNTGQHLELKLNPTPS